MELKLEEVVIVVASHQEASFRNLKPPYSEVCVNFQSIRPYGYSHYVTMSSSGLRFPDEWSEVAILLLLDSFVGEAKFVGLQHYRRFFSLDLQILEPIISLPRSARNEFVENQIQKLTKLEEIVVIPQKWEFTESVFDQFVTCHPNLEDLLLFTLEELDSVLSPIFGEVSTLQLMIEKSTLHPFNMFLGPREFHSEWSSVLRSLIPKVEEYAERFQGQLGERWGGYIVERLFSIYITLCQQSNRWCFIEKPVVLFDGSDPLTQQCDELTQQCDELTQQCDELTQQRDELTQQRDELTQQRDELTQQRDEIIDSTIWKLTNPVRKAIDIFKK
jgi:FtsZ-binding cell division protein ZapB